ncbi:riboflavin synthase [Qipengyuania sp. JC766]|uniref:riboflavin synthase n=1 Tax=Qipengyuania sp. JC766 TaxID=3232139 RepID=UPI00345A11C3
MFTGIVTAIGTITQVERRADLRVRIACPYDPDTMAIGASIACSGVCLTVVDRGGQEGDAWFAVDVSQETVSRTAKGQWETGRRLNLERALKVGDELGGHLVTGHVDCLGTIRMARDEGGSTRLAIRAPAEYAPFLAPKGSITIDGVSLTVNDVRDQADRSCDFALNIIPHTGEVTTLGALEEGDTVNLEIDVLARYLKRMQAVRG